MGNSVLEKCSIGGLFVFLGCMMWLLDIREWLHLKNEGKRLYSFKKHGWDLYMQTGTCLIFSIIYSLDYMSGEGYIPLWIVIFWNAFFVINLLGCIKKYGIYENGLVIRNGCYRKDEVISFQWKNYVEKPQAIALMLEIPAWRRFKSKRTTMVEVEVSKEEQEKIEETLISYGIEKKVTENTALNIEQR